MIPYIKKKSRIFYDELLYPRHFRILIIAYITLKTASNMIYSSSYLAGLRSGIISIVLYWAGMYAINLLSPDEKQGNATDELSPRTAKIGLIISIIYSAFLYLIVIDSLQSKNILIGSSILSYIPGYNGLISFLDGISSSLAEIAGILTAQQAGKIITGVLFYVFIPLLIFCLCGYSFKGQFSVRNSTGAWPLVILFIILFIAGGINKNKLWGFAYSILYPALCEEFFHRGIVYRSCAVAFKNPPAALLAGTAAFSLMHFPDYFYRVYAGSMSLALSNMGDVLLFGLLMAYGYKKTGTLLPWILIHALSDCLNL
ncbi:MAG TPA: CPBP family intramembrane metalloprotease [Clostridiales bacterium]|nr:CPBP family intramembrane metalloprotease [Clostridiales bacterium]